MPRFLVRRFLLTIPVLLGVITLVFSLVHLVPGDPVQIMLGEGARASDVDQLRQRLGLDRPILVQYVSYLKGLVRGNWGTSFRFAEPVGQIISERYPATLELALLSLVVCVFIAIPAGIFAATRAGSWLDRWVTTGTLLGI